MVYFERIVAVTPDSRISTLNDLLVHTHKNGRPETDKGINSSKREKKSKEISVKRIKFTKKVKRDRW